MVTTTILITGGLVVAGTRILLRRRRTRTPVWLIQRDGSRVKSYAVVVESEEVTALSRERELSTNYTLSTVSLGLNLAGELLLEPVRWLGLPLDIYSLAVIIEQSSGGLNGPRRGAQIVAISVCIITLTLSDQFVIISFVQWSYFFYRIVALDVQKRLAAMASAAHATST